MVGEVQITVRFFRVKSQKYSELDIGGRETCDDTFDQGNKMRNVA